MFDEKLVRKGLKVKVKDIAHELQKLPQDADFCVCGDDLIYIHVEKDKSVVSLDNELLDDCYENCILESEVLNIISPIEFTVKDKLRSGDDLYMHRALEGLCFQVLQDHNVITCDNDITSEMYDKVKNRIDTFLDERCTY